MRVESLFLRGCSRFLSLVSRGLFGCRLARRLGRLCLGTGRAFAGAVTVGAVTVRRGLLGLMVQRLLLSRSLAVGDIPACALEAYRHRSDHTIDVPPLAARAPLHRVVAELLLQFEFVTTIRTGVLVGWHTGGLYPRVFA